MRKPRKCSIEGCGKPHIAGGYCRAHYYRNKHHGDPLMGRKPRTPRAVIDAFVQAHIGYTGEECVIWPFTRDNVGYARGKFTLDGKTYGPFAYLYAVSSGIPRPTPTHQAAHNCGNGRGGCVNPSHIRWATPLENTRDKERHGTMLRGERGGNAKLSEKDVEDIVNSPESNTSLSLWYDIHPSVISKIRAGVIWSTVTPRMPKTSRRVPPARWAKLFMRYAALVSETYGSSMLTTDLAANDGEREAIARILRAENENRLSRLAKG